MKFFLLFSFAFMAITAPSVFAQDNAPKPSQHPAHELEQKRKETEGQKKALESKVDEINADMTKTQKELVDIAGQIKKNESTLNDLDKRISDNHSEQKEIEKRLRRDKGSIGDLVLALERINRTPPEAVLARPGAPLETAQSAMLLQSILPNIYGRAEGLKKDIGRLDEIILSLEKDQAQAKQTAEELAARQKKMSDLLAKRKDLHAKTQKEIQLSDKTLADIAAQAKDLQDLVARIERQQKEESRTRLSVPKDDLIEDAPSVSRKMRTTPMPQAGAAQLPISGLIRVGYKQTDDIGAESQGLTIEGRPSALVVAPMGGIVRYAGFFKNYGKIIIVEHQKDYHSLIAGLSRIDTVVGQSVSVGEPIGTLPRTSSDGGKPSLYYELRLNGEPVNPARKFAGL